MLLSVSGWRPENCGKTGAGVLGAFSLMDGSRLGNDPVLGFGVRRFRFVFACLFAFEDSVMEVARRPRWGSLLHCLGLELLFDLDSGHLDLGEVGT